jgi:hypothetical protein
MAICRSEIEATQTFMNDSVSKTEAQKAKEAIIQEVFVAYREAGVVRKKASNPELKSRMEIVRHNLDMILRRLFPLTEYQEDVWREVRFLFRN